MIAPGLVYSLSEKPRASPAPFSTYTSYFFAKSSISFGNKMTLFSPLMVSFNTATFFIFSLLLHKYIYHDYINFHFVYIAFQH